MKRCLLVLVVFAAGVLMAGEPALLVKVDDFDRSEIQRYHDIIVEAVKRRDLLIETAAKRHKIDISKATYDIIAGEFRSKTEDKADGK